MGLRVEPLESKSSKEKEKVISGLAVVGHMAQPNTGLIERCKIEAQKSLYQIGRRLTVIEMTYLMNNGLLTPIK